MIDLDGLKALNDSAGHAAGDELIARAARALTEAKTAACHVARYGGDEFMILANGVVPATVEAHFAGYAGALEQAGVRASIGFAAAEPGLVTLEKAVETADQMMYDRKRAGRVRR